MTTQPETMPLAEGIDRLPFEVADFPDVAVHDYVRFYAIIETEEHFVRGARSVTGTRKVKVAVPRGGPGRFSR